MSEARTFCSDCGAAASGNFCSQCGARVAGGCPHCGARLSAGALYCAECGGGVGARTAKPASAWLPWVLSAAVLVGFSLVIAQLVQRGSVQRTGDMTITGGLPTSGEPATAAGASGMPSLEELASMTPRQAADRLYERAMSEHEGGDFERAAFFLDMGLQAYAAVPPDEMDADARFHVGLMQLLMGDSVSARLTGDEILEAEPDNLLGLVLSARVADFAGDEAAAAGYRSRLRSAVGEAGTIPDRPEYQSHRPVIQRELELEGS